MPMGSPPEQRLSKDYNLAFKDDLAKAQDDLQALINQLIFEQSFSQINDGMKYACQGGKRLRGFLAMEWGRMLGAEPIGAMRVGAAVEFVHAYSLVHDDLPCMDDAALRRGGSATHLFFGQPTAILAAVSRIALAFNILGALTVPHEQSAALV